MRVKFAIDGSTKKYQQISNTEYDSMENQSFLRYVHDIVRTVRGNTKELLDAVNNFHPSLQLALETTGDKKSSPFVDVSVNVQPEGTIFCTGYQKPSVTGTILNYRSLAPTPPIPSQKQLGNIP